VDLVHFQEHHTDHPGHLNIIADQESRSFWDYCNWILSISKNKGDDGAPEGGFICFSPKQATTPVLQLESRSRSNSNGCLYV